MKKTLRITAGGLATYSVLWLATFLLGPVILQHQLLAAAREDRARLLALPGRAPGDSVVGREAPTAEVNEVFCPAPFYFRARVRVWVGPLNAYGFGAGFFWTPWHVYRLTTGQGEWIAGRPRPTPPAGGTRTGSSRPSPGSAG